MDILTFDIEEWSLAKTGGYGSRELYCTYDRYLDNILSILNDRKIIATFFCVGKMGEDFPDVVRKIHDAGHEIGCHSYRHSWLNKMSEVEGREDTRMAVDALEQCIGEKVLSYRAPAFSIGPSNLWAFEALVENGILYDSSVFPAQRDFGGFPNFNRDTPVYVEYKGRRLLEFPIPTFKLVGKKIAYSGGGYFRLFPLSYIERWKSCSDYFMAYFHLADLISVTHGLMSKEKYESYFREKGSFLKRVTRFVKSNIGKKNAFVKLKSLLDADSVFIPVRSAAKIVSNAECVQLVQI